MLRYIDITDATTIKTDTVGTFNSQNLETYLKANVLVVNGVFNAKPVTATQEEWGYPYTNMTILNIVMKDGYKFSIELQDVANQATWSTGLATGLSAALVAINASL